MMKRNKAILCALASIGIMTSVSTVKANAMTMNTNTTKTTFKACEVEDWMYSLPYTFKMDIGEQLKAGVGMAYMEYAYNSLGEKQRYVDPGAVDTLRQAEKRLVKLFEGEQQAYNIASRINKIEDAIGYNQNTKAITNKASLESNAKNIEKLKKEIVDIEDAYSTLDYSIKYSDNLEYFMDGLYGIEAALVNLGL